MSDLFNTSATPVLLLLANNGTGTSLTQPSGTGNLKRSGIDTSTIQNIAFGVIATTLTGTGVIITYLQYRHMRSSTTEASRTNTDLELGSLESRIETEISDEDERLPIPSLTT